MLFKFDYTKKNNQHLDLGPARCGYAGTKHPPTCQPHSRLEIDLGLCVEVALCPIILLLGEKPMEVSSLALINAAKRINTFLIKCGRAKVTLSPKQCHRHSEARGGGRIGDLRR